MGKYQISMYPSTSGTTHDTPATMQGGWWRADCCEHFTGNWGLWLIPPKMLQDSGSPHCAHRKPWEEEIFVWLCESPVFLSMLIKIQLIRASNKEYPFTLSSTRIQPLHLQPPRLGVIHNICCPVIHPTVSNSELQREKSRTRLKKHIQHQWWFSGIAKHNIWALVHGASQTLPPLIKQQNLLMTTDS